MKRRFGLPLELRIREARLDEWAARRRGNFDAAVRYQEHANRLEQQMGGKFSMWRRPAVEAFARHVPTPPKETP